MIAYLYKENKSLEKEIIKLEKERLYLLSKLSKFKDIKQS